MSFMCFYFLNLKVDAIRSWNSVILLIVFLIYAKLSVNKPSTFKSSVYNCKILKKKKLCVIIFKCCPLKLNFGDEISKKRCIFATANMTCDV